MKLLFIKIYYYIHRLIWPAIPNITTKEHVPQKRRQIKKQQKALEDLLNSSVFAVELMLKSRPNLLELATRVGVYLVPPGGLFNAYGDIGNDSHGLTRLEYFDPANPSIAPEWIVKFADDPDSNSKGFFQSLAYIRRSTNPLHRIVYRRYQVFAVGRILPYSNGKSTDIEESFGIFNPKTGEFKALKNSQPIEKFEGCEDYALTAPGAETNTKIEELFYLVCNVYARSAFHTQIRFKKIKSSAPVNYLTSVDQNDFKYLFRDRTDCKRAINGNRAPATYWRGAHYGVGNDDKARNRATILINEQSFSWRGFETTIALAGKGRGESSYSMTKGMPHPLSLPTLKKTITADQMGASLEGYLAAT